MRRLPLFILAIACTCVGGKAWAQGGPSEAQIEEAKNRGLAFLRRSPNQNLGISALMCVTLLKNGDSPDSPAVKSRIDEILQRQSTGSHVPSPSIGMTEIYEAGVCLMALANADPEKYKKEITVLTQYLIAKQLPTGAWDYPTPGVTGDTSVTQYAVLGLWEASRCGVPVPKRLWDRVAAWHIQTQAPDGGFSYKPVLKGNQTAFHTMTFAGSGSLYIARLHLYPEAGALAPDAAEKAAAQAERKRLRPKYGFLYPVAPGEEDSPPKPGGTTKAPTENGNYTVVVPVTAIDTALSRSSRWIQSNWTATPQTQWAKYYLYCVERYGALSGSPVIGDVDWYEAGAAALLASQNQDGSWTDASGHEASTCFGVLFLSKATQKMVNAPPKRRRKGSLGTGLLQGGRGLPENLNQLKLDGAGVGVKKLKGPVADLLAELEKASSDQIESAQATIVDQVLVEKPEELVGQKDRLKKLAVDRRPEVRRTAFWALARTDDLRLAPLLIKGLEDPEADCVVEAHQGLIFLSRKVQEPDLPEELTPAFREQLLERWRSWYLSVRPYDERDDLTPSAEKKKSGR